MSELVAQTWSMNGSTVGGLDDHQHTIRRPIMRI